jgi:hypothetical protein
LVLFLRFRLVALLRGCTPKGAAQYIKNRTAGSDHSAALFLDDKVAAVIAGAAAAAFGVFHRLEVMDLDLLSLFLFLCLVLHVILKLVVVSVCVSDTKKPHRGIEPQYGSLS